MATCGELGAKILSSGTPANNAAGATAQEYQGDPFAAQCAVKSTMKTSKCPRTIRKVLTTGISISE